MRKYLLQIVPPSGHAATFDTAAASHEVVNDNGRSYIKFKDESGKIALDVCVGHTHSYALTFTEKDNGD